MRTADFLHSLFFTARRYLPVEELADLPLLHKMSQGDSRTKGAFVR